MAKTDLFRKEDSALWCMDAYCEGNLAAWFVVYRKFLSSPEGDNSEVMYCTGCKNYACNYLTEQMVSVEPIRVGMMIPDLISRDGDGCPLNYNEAACDDLHSDADHRVRFVPEDIN